MYRGSLYGKHDETMNAFAEKFNNNGACPNLRMEPNRRETFDNDGYFTDTATGERIGFDWEYRDRHFSNCRLAFPTLGQYERKLRKPSIQIAIQCDSTETGSAVGWHEDWLREERERRLLKTDGPEKQDGFIRCTERFKIYRMEEIGEFKEMINRAMKHHIYHAAAFAADVHRPGTDHFRR